MWLELRLQFRPECPSLNARGAADAIHLEHFVQALHIQRDHTGIAVTHRRLNAATDAGATAVRHDRNIVAPCPIKNVGNRLFIVRKCHGIDPMREFARPHTRQIGVTLADAVVEAIEWRGREHRREAGGRCHARCRQGKVAFLRNRVIHQTAAQVAHHQTQARLLVGGDSGICIAPTPKAAGAATGQSDGCGVGVGHGRAAPKAGRWTLSETLRSGHSLQRHGNRSRIDSCLRRPDMRYSAIFLTSPAPRRSHPCAVAPRHPW